MTVEESLDYLTHNAEDWYKRQLRENFSSGVAQTAAEVELNEHIPSKWVNPLETRLPLASNLKIYCFYGIRKPTERSFFYREEHDPLTAINVTIDTGLNAGEVDRGR